MAGMMSQDTMQVLLDELLSSGNFNSWLFVQQHIMFEYHQIMGLDESDTDTDTEDSRDGLDGSDYDDLPDQKPGAVSFDFMSNSKPDLIAAANNSLSPLTEFHLFATLPDDIQYDVWDEAMGFRPRLILAHPLKVASGARGLVVTLPNVEGRGRKLGFEWFDWLSAAAYPRRTILRRYGDPLRTNLMFDPMRDTLQLSQNMPVHSANGMTSAWMQLEAARRQLRGIPLNLVPPLAFWSRGGCYGAPTDRPLDDAAGVVSLICRNLCCDRAGRPYQYETLVRIKSCPYTLFLSCMPSRIQRVVVMDSHGLQFLSSQVIRRGSSSWTLHQEHGMELLLVFFKMELSKDSLDAQVLRGLVKAYIKEAHAREAVQDVWTFRLCREIRNELSGSDGPPSPAFFKSLGCWMLFKREEEPRGEGPGL